MNEIKTLNEALDLLYKYKKTIISKGYGAKSIMYRVFGDMIVVINNNFKSFITKEEFMESFYKSKFYLVEIEVSETEIDQNHIVYRQ